VSFGVEFNSLDAIIKVPLLMEDEKEVTRTSSKPKVISTARGRGNERVELRLMSEGRLFWGLGALLFLLTLLIFLPGIGGEFLRWDDDINITANPRIGSLTVENILWMFSDGSYALRYKPLSWITWAAAIAIFGESAIAMKMLNLVLHSSNAALLFALVIRLSLIMGAERSGLRSLVIGFAAFLTSAFWAIHPLRAEPVAWISGLGYPLATFFFLGGMLVFCSRKNLFSTKLKGLDFVAVGFFVLSILSYPVTVLGFIAFPAVKYFVLRSKTNSSVPVLNAATFKVLLLFSAPAFLATFAAILIRYLPSEWDAAPALQDFGLLERIIQAIHVLCIYISHTVFPFGLLPFYDEVKSLPVGGHFLVSGVVLIGLFLTLRRKLRFVTGCGVVVVFSAVPVLGITESIFNASDRYTYFLALLFSPVIMSIVLDSFGIIKDMNRVRIASVFALAFLTAFGTTTALTVPQWKDNDSFFWSAMDGAQVEENRFFLAHRWIRITIELEGWDAAGLKLELLADKEGYFFVHKTLQEHFERAMLERAASSMGGHSSAVLARPSGG
jgi:protein O-mannosyl-transferase